MVEPQFCAETFSDEELPRKWKKIMYEIKCLVIKVGSNEVPIDREFPDQEIVRTPRIASQFYGRG